VIVNKAFVLTQEVSFSFCLGCTGIGVA